MNRIKLFFPVLFLWGIIPFLTACGSTTGGVALRELNQLNVVMVTGIDYDIEKKEYILSIQSVKPATTQDEGISKETVYKAKATGKTIMEAAKNLRASTSGKLIWFHSKTFILGGDLLRTKGFKEVVDFLARNREIRLTAWVLTTHNKATDIITVKPNSEVTLGDELQGIIANQKEWGKSTVLTLKDLINLYENPHQGFVTGHIVEKEGIEGEKIIAIEGATVIHQQKFLMHLNKEKIKPYQLLKKVGDEEPEIIFNVSLGDGEKEEKEVNTAVQVVVKNRQRKVTLKNGVPAISIRLNMDATIMETGTEENLRTNEVNEKVLQEVSRQMRIQVEDLLYKVQKEMKVDIFDFSGLIHRKEKKYWREHEKNWHDIYPEIPVQMTVDWNLVRNGMISHMEQGEQK